MIQLKTIVRDLIKFKKKIFFKGLGDRMGNESPFLLSLNIMWFRHHNWLARNLRDQHLEWDDHTVFAEARIRNIATFQVKNKPIYFFQNFFSSITS